MSDFDPHASFAVETAPIGPRRRRRGPEPLVVGAAIVALALVVAVVKPWDGDTGAARSGASAPAPASVAAIPTASAAVVPFDLSDPANAERAVSVLERHDRWGIRVVTRKSGTAGRPGLVEQWLEVDPAPDIVISPLIVTSTPGIIALGITSPADVTPLDVRAWAVGEDGQWHWLDVGSVASERPAADLLLPPPTVDGTTLAAWPSGRYRFDLLTGPSVVRIDLTIDPDVALSAAPLSAWRSTSRDRPADAPGADVPSGAYGVMDGFVVPLSGGGGPARSDPEAWIATDAIASTWLPAATGLGVVMPEGARDAFGSIRLITPDPRFSRFLGAAVLRTGMTEAAAPYVQFDVATGNRFEPGVYAIDATWSEAGQRRTSTWTIELRPGRFAREPTLLNAARRYGEAAGRDGLVLTGAGRWRPDPASAPVRFFPMAASIGCDDDLIDEAPAVIGLGHALDIEPRSIAASLLGANGRQIEVPLRVAPVVEPGLTLVAPARRVAFPEGIYTFTWTAAGGPRSTTVCLGT